jgi:hypothetical protein
MSVLENPVTPSVRRRGLIRFVAGLAGFGVMLAIGWGLNRAGHLINPHEMMVVGLPGAYALAGLVEMLTGVAFSELSRRWDALRGWQRGIFGTFIVLMAGGVLFCGGVLLCYYLYK